MRRYQKSITSMGNCASSLIWKVSKEIHPISVWRIWNKKKKWRLNILLSNYFGVIDLQTNKIKTSMDRKHSIILNFAWIQSYMHVKGKFFLNKGRRNDSSILKYYGTTGNSVYKTCSLFCYILLIS